MSFERYEYDEESDVLDIFFSEEEFHRRAPVWTIELTSNIMISIDRAMHRAVQLTLMDYSILLHPTDAIPQSFPITGVASLPEDERRMVLKILNSPPVNRWLDISTVQLLPDSPFTVTHLEPPPLPLKEMIPVLA